jgi:hypothetical protein
MTSKSHSGPVVTGSGHPSRFPAIAITRRGLLAGAAFTVAFAIWNSSALAQVDAVVSATSNFFNISMAITGKSDLSTTTSERIYAAFQAADSSFPDKIAQLAPLAHDTDTPDAFKNAAAGLGLGDVLMAIVAAWYTGTVETKNGSILVSYAEALMYRPVADGLTVPTYCNKGPLWWTGLPPAITTMPKNNPKVL